MSKPSDNAYGFEGVKVFLRQDKNGYTMGVSIHPNDVPEALMRDLVGQRYMFAMVPLNDDDTPRVVSVEKLEDDPYLGISATPPTRDEDTGDDAARAVTQAGILCRDREFQQWMGGSPLSEARTVSHLHHAVGVASRAELKTDEHARRKFYEIVQNFELWRGAYRDSVV